MQAMRLRWQHGLTGVTRFIISVFDVRMPLLLRVRVKDVISLVRLEEM